MTNFHISQSTRWLGWLMRTCSFHVTRFKQTLPESSDGDANVQHFGVNWMNMTYVREVLVFVTSCERALTGICTTFKDFVNNMHRKSPCFIPVCLRWCTISRLYENMLLCEHNGVCLLVYTNCTHCSCFFFFCFFLYVLSCLFLLHFTYFFLFFSLLCFFTSFFRVMWDYTS